MAQAKITNHTACEYQTLFANDELFRPVLTPVIKATFDIAADGKLKFAENQVPICLDGEHIDEPETSSYVYEPECAFIKTNTDVVVIGDAVSGAGPVTHLLVDIRVGNLHKKLGVIGDREWIKQSVGYAISEVTPFESMPLTYENAFGGWDKRHEKIELQGFEARNTVGKGYYRTDVEHVPGEMPLPNIEDPDALITSIKDKPAPVGCGFTLPHWQPRVQFAGTYDQAWQEERSPMLPADFDRRYFNAASDGLMAAGYLTGREAVVIKNMTASGLLQFSLPGARPPVCEVEFKSTYEELPTLLDTVIINVREMQVQLIWRNCLILPSGPHSVEAIDIRYG